MRITLRGGGGVGLIGGVIVGKMAVVVCANVDLNTCLLYSVDMSGDQAAKYVNKLI